MIEKERPASLTDRVLVARLHQTHAEIVSPHEIDGYTAYCNHGPRTLGLLQAGSYIKRAHISSVKTTECFLALDAIWTTLSRHLVDYVPTCL